MYLINDGYGSGSGSGASDGDGCGFNNCTDIEIIKI